jgi:microcystin-dependent protein
MGLFHYKWSRTAASNATADSNVNFAEGQAPSTVNDSARALMASAAGFRDDIAGAITTGGTSTAYTVTSYQIFDSLANMSGSVIAFTPHTTNGATVTLNVDGLGAKPLRSAPSVELFAGTLIQGTPYTALYNNSDAVWYLHNFHGNPYNIPLAGGLTYYGPTAPNSAFAFPYGQAISRTTYATLFAIIGTDYGAGDGSTTFTLPDVRGRVEAGKDDMGGSAASRLGGGVLTGTTLGATGGSDVIILSTSQIPSHTHTGTTETVSADHAHTYSRAELTAGQTGGGAFPGFAGTYSSQSTGGMSANHTHTFTTDAAGSGGSHINMQPTIITNKLIRII